METSQLSLTGLEPTSSRRASLANPILSPGSDWARKMTVQSGRSLLKSLDGSSQVGACLRMLLESSTWRSTACYLTWKRKATKSGRSYYQLVPSTPRTEGIGCGLWRTPDASIVTGGAANAEDRKRQGHAIGLHDQVNTPTMWPTPTAQDGANNGGPSQFRRNSVPLNAAVPIANRWDGLQSHGVNVVEGSLNPQFVEYLMNFPTDWTKLE